MLLTGNVKEQKSASQIQMEGKNIMTSKLRQSASLISGWTERVRHPQNSIASGKSDNGPEPKSIHLPLITINSY